MQFVHTVFVYSVQPPVFYLPEAQVRQVVHSPFMPVTSPSPFVVPVQVSSPQYWFRLQDVQFVHTVFVYSVQPPVF